MRPKNLEDIIALISLYRPGPMDSIPTYLRNRKDPSHVTYKTPQMAHIVDVTNACHLSGAGHADLPRAGRLQLRPG